MAKAKTRNGNGNGQATVFIPWALALFSIVLIELGRFFFGGSIRAEVIAQQTVALKAEINAVETRLGKRIDRLEDMMMRLRASRIEP